MTLQQLLNQYVGSAFSLKIYLERGNLLATVPNRGNEYEPEPLTPPELRKHFGPGTYRVQVVGNGSGRATVMGRIYGEAVVVA